MFVRNDARFISVSIDIVALSFLTLSKTDLNIPLLHSTFPFLWDDRARLG